MTETLGGCMLAHCCIKVIFPKSNHHWQVYVSIFLYKPSLTNLKKLDPLTEVNIMLGFDCQKDEDLVLNFCLILAKYYIYTCKRNQMQIDFLGYMNKLKQKLTTEEAIHFKNSTSNIFDKIWGFLAEQI